MKIMHEQVTFHGNSAVKVKLQEKPHFTYPWHFHSEYELVYVLKGDGTRFVANCVEEFGKDDFVFVGTGLPHFWKANELYHTGDNQKKIKYIVIQFSNNFFRNEINNYPEFVGIKGLFKNAERGIHFSADLAQSLKKQIIELTKEDGFSRTIMTLNLLNTLSKAKKIRLLASEAYHIGEFNFDSDRFSRIMHYLNSNYRGEIVLEKVAEIANLQVASFCRFFKAKTGKTLSTFVNDMRVSYACQLIIDGKLSVSQICFESGFNNLSNFNRTFKKSTGLTPKGYFQEFHK